MVVSIINIVLGIGVIASWWFKGKGAIPALPSGGISSIIRVVADLIEKLPHDEGTKTQIADNLMTGLREAETSSLTRQLESKTANRLRTMVQADNATTVDLKSRIEELAQLVRSLQPLPVVPAKA